MISNKKPLVSNLNKYLLLANIFFLQSYLIRFQIGPYPTNLQEVLIIIQLLFFTIHIILNKKIKNTFKNLKNHWVIVTLISLTGLSVIIVATPDFLNFARHLKFLFFASILTFIFLETFNTNQKKLLGIKIMGLGALVFGLFCGIYNPLGYNVTHDYRLLGPLDSAVYLAYYLTPFFIFFTIRAFEKKEQSNIYHAIALGLLILATRSMGAIGASFSIILFFLFKKNNLPFLKTKTGKISLSLIGIIIVGGIFYTKVLPTIQTSYSSLDERGEIWLTAIDLFKEPKNAIFGLGFGQFEHHYIKNVDQVLGHQPLDYEVIQPHNIFLLFWSHFGILGLVFIIFIFVKTILNITKKLPKNLNIQKISLFILAYFLLHGLIDTPIFKNDILIIFLIFLELGLSKKLYLSPETKSIKTE